MDKARWQYERAQKLLRQANAVDPVSGLGLSPAERDLLEGEAQSARIAGDGLYSRARQEREDARLNSVRTISPATQRQIDAAKQHQKELAARDEGFVSVNTNAGRVSNKVENLRNGETTMMIRIPERESDRSYRRLNSNTMTAAPNYN